MTVQYINRRTYSGRFSCSYQISKYLPKVGDFPCCFGDIEKTVIPLLMQEANASKNKQHLSVRNY